MTKASIIAIATLACFTAFPSRTCIADQPQTAAPKVPETPAGNWVKGRAYSVLPDSAHTLSGPVADGLALAIYPTTYIVRRGDRIVLRAELRNVSSRVKYVGGGVYHTSAYRPTVNERSTGRHIVIGGFSHLDPGSGSINPSGGIPVPPKKSLFYKVYLDAWVDLAPGSYLVRLQAVSVRNEQTRLYPDLRSNTVVVTVQ